MKYLGSFLRVFVMVLGSVSCLCISANAQQTMDFDGKSVLNSNSLPVNFKFYNRTHLAEYTTGIIGKGLRTDGYSTYLSGKIGTPNNTSAISGWFALESFPTDTAAFFALKSHKTGESISVGVDRFGEIIIGKGSNNGFSYLPTGHFVQNSGGLILHWVSKLQALVFG